MRSAVFCTCMWPSDWPTDKLISKNRGILYTRAALLNKAKLSNALLRVLSDKARKG